jgi:hypothetical protein
MRIAIFLKSIHIKKISGLVVTSKKLKINSVGLVTSGLRPDMAHGLLVRPL